MPGPAKMSGGPHAHIVQVLLAHQPVRADRQAVIAEKNDQRILAQLAIVENLQQAADLGVHVFDRSIIVGEMFLHFVFAARPGGELLRRGLSSRRC